MPFWWVQSLFVGFLVFCPCRNTPKGSNCTSPSKATCNFVKSYTQFFIINVLTAK